MIPRFDVAIPVLRMFSVDKAREFYIGWLGLTVDWEHRFEPEAPLYMQLSRAGMVLHLSEHHGDGSPGAHVFVRMAGVADFHREITAKNYKYNRPALEDQPWGLTFTVVDPCNNRLHFNEPPRRSEGEAGPASG
jgi:catechol 2,3-dioxygenase-like lactoylglutathione lyase family enzyme